MFVCTFTPEEKEKILKNLRDIEIYTLRWARQMRPGEAVYVGTDNKTFGISLDAKGTVSRMWYNGFCFVSTDKRDRNIYESWSYALDIFTDWEDIKIAMDDEVEKLNNKRKAILKFNIEGKSKYKD